MRVSTFAETHHLGITSEETADAIAWAIANASGTRDTCGQAAAAPLPLAVPVGLSAKGLICADSILEGEDQHPLTRTYVFEDPMSAEGPIRYTAQRIGRWSGRVTIANGTYLPIASLGYPRVDSDSGVVSIFSSRTGRLDASPHPAQYSMAKFEIKDLQTDRPSLTVSLLYARTDGGDEFVPSGTFRCQRQ